MLGELSDATELSPPVEAGVATPPVGPEPASGGARTVFGVLWEDAEVALLICDANRMIRDLNPVAVAGYSPLGMGRGSIINEAQAVEVTSLDGSRSFAPHERPLERALRGESVARQTLTVRYRAWRPPPST